MATRIPPVPVVALDNYESDLLRLLDQACEEIPHARNGRAVAGDAYADQVMKDIKAGRSKEVRRLLAVLLAMLQRGAKRPAVRLFAQRLDAILARHGSDDQPRAIRILNRRETREDGMLNLTQMRLEADPDNVDALEGVVRQAAFYRCALDELVEEANDRIVALRAGGMAGRRLALVES